MIQANQQAKSIYCCGCQEQVVARLTSGEEIYPHRSDLHNLPFWKCDACNNYVGCHWKTANRTNPLGNIPTKDLRYARMRIHEILDPIWKKGIMNRRKLYTTMAKELGISAFHIAEIKTVEEAERAYSVVRKLIGEMK